MDGALKPNRGEGNNDETDAHVSTPNVHSRAPRKVLEREWGSRLLGRLELATLKFPSREFSSARHGWRGRVL
eukprot:1612597-Alexandrium_andersonii.AAC.1